MTTREQSMSALEVANRVRLYRADVKRKVKDGDVAVADCLADPLLSTMPIMELLEAQRQWQTTRARRTLFHLGVRETTLGRLSLRERGQLAVFFGRPDRVDAKGVWVLRDGEMEPRPYA